jgi:Uma2 family endonuclease
MSPAVNINADLTPGEIYARLAWIKGLTVELLGGNVVVRGGNSNRHAQLVWRLTSALVRRVTAMEAAVFTGRATPILATLDVPRPDLAVVPDAASDCYAHHLLLAAEVVALGTFAEDRHVKPLLYARGGVPLYLLVDFETVTLFSEPRDGAYQSEATVPVGEKLALPDPFGIELDTQILNCPLWAIQPEAKMSVASATLPLTSPLRSQGTGGDDGTMATTTISRVPEVPAAMSPAVDIHAELSVEEIYEQLASVEHLHVELLDGRVVVTGGASIRHNEIVWGLIRALYQLATLRGWQLLNDQPVHIKATRDRAKPDLLVMPRNAPRYDDGELFAHGLLLVAEVVSPSRATDDRLAKKRIYAQGRVPLYLLVDFETVTLFSEPRDGSYQSEATVAIGEKLELPDPFGIDLDTVGLVP